MHALLTKSGAIRPFKSHGKWLLMKTTTDGLAVIARVNNSHYLGRLQKTDYLDSPPHKVETSFALSAWSFKPCKRLIHCETVHFLPPALAHKVLTIQAGNHVKCDFKEIILALHDLIGYQSGYKE